MITRKIVALLLLISALSFGGEMQKAIQPYLLPAEHKLKPALDAIFNESRVTFNDQSLRESGFKILFSKKRSFIRVARHPDLPGHLIKANLDSFLKEKKGTPTWKWFARRCQGAAKIRRVIAQSKFANFQAPRKWIYLLPNKPAPPKGVKVLRQSVVLLVEDMQLEPWEKNLEAWKKMSHRHLDELYQIIRNAGGSSYRPDNIWLSKNGKFSFIDTEYPYAHGKFDTVRRYLSPRNKKYWDQLIKQGGPS